MNCLLPTGTGILKIKGMNVLVIVSDPLALTSACTDAPALAQAAATNQKSIMLYDDPQLSRLNDASHIITSGSLPTWMSEHKVDELLKRLLPACQEAGAAKNPHTQLGFLAQKVHEHIHVIICAGSGSNSLLKFYQNFPGMRVPRVVV